MIDLCKLKMWVTESNDRIVWGLFFVVVASLSVFSGLRGNSSYPCPLPTDFSYTHDKDMFRTDYLQM